MRELTAVGARQVTTDIYRDSQGQNALLDGTVRSYDRAGLSGKLTGLFGPAERHVRLVQDVAQLHIHALQPQRRSGHGPGALTARDRGGVRRALRVVQAVPVSGARAVGL